MRILFVAIALLIALPCFAKTSMKLTGEMAYQFNAKDIPPPTIGVGIWQSLGNRFAYNTWSGLGHQARLDDPTVRWFATKHDFIYYWSNMELAVGYVYKTANQDKSGGTLDVDEHAVKAKLSLKIF